MNSVKMDIGKLHPFEGHPFKVQDNEEMDALVESIQSQGILTPLIVRKKENTTDEYEIISGHRRYRAAMKAGLETVPAFIYTLDRNAAAIMLVDCNLHRERLLPSEKAFAYKLKMDAMSRQGQRTDLTSRQVVGKLETADLIADNESGRQVQRYIRLTELIPEILQMVDDGKIALTPAVELSYLTKQEQRDLLETMESEDCTPSLSQAIQLKKLSQAGELNMDKIFDILREPKANQQDKISFRVDDLRKFFPKSYSATRIQETILKLLTDYYRKRERSREER